MLESREMLVPTHSKPEYLSKAVASKRLKLSVRRLMELSQAGKIERFRQFDPQTRRDATVFDAADIARLKAEWTPQPVKSSRALVRASRAYLSGPQAPEWAQWAAKPVRPWLTIDEAADYSGLPASVLRKMILAGQLKALDVGHRAGGIYRVRRADLDDIQGSLCQPVEKPVFKPFVRTHAK